MASIDEIRAASGGFGYTDILTHLPAVETASGHAPPLKLAVLRSYTAESLLPLLRFHIALDGRRPEMLVGGFNQYAQEILDSGSALYSFGPEMVLLMVRIEELMPDFCDDFGSRGKSDWEEALGAKADEIGRLVRLLSTKLSARVVVQNAAAPAFPYWGAYDAQAEGGQACLTEFFNQKLAGALRDVAGANIWDFARLAREVGHESLFDPKMWFFSKNPYKLSACAAIAADLMRYVRSSLGQVKKCVVLDLDGTLWGGVVGEDGLAGIALGHTYPGNCYREFQQQLLRLYRRGLILAVNSKNNEADALEVFDSHPEMVLRREHIAAWEINWNDKVSNLRALAATLNIGIDSMIMLDDNPVECEHIRQSLPECGVVLLPSQPYLLPGIVNRLAGVDNIRLTDEDRRKGEIYRAQAERRREERRFASLSEYLETLDLKVSIEAASAYSIPRVAQLTQKTNQMNVTTRRYSEADIRSLVSNEQSSVFAVSCDDRFGQNGIIGVLILRHYDLECTIDTLLLSCRVIGRDIEAAMLAFAFEFARARGAQCIIGEFFPTAKNQPAAGIYERFGFEKVSDTRFRADVASQAVKTPPYISVTVTA